MTSAPATKQTIEQKKESPTTDSEQKITNGSKLKVTAKIKPNPKVNKEFLAEKDDEKSVGVAITLEKLEEVGPSAAMRKRQLEKLPLAYHSSYVIRLTKLDNELFEDEVVLSEYVFGYVEDVDER